MQKPTAYLGKRLSSLLLRPDPTQNGRLSEDQHHCPEAKALPRTGIVDHKAEVLVESHNDILPKYGSENLFTTKDSPVALHRRPGHAEPGTKTSNLLNSYLPEPWSYRNRALSIRSKSSKRNDGGANRKPFSFQSLRGNMQPELSRKLYKVIKSSNNLITAHDTAAKERTVIATELSEWGEQTQDEAVSDISDKIGVILSELGEQEDTYAHNLEESRGILKSIRNTEKSVQPSRDNKAKIADEIQKLKMKEPQSPKLVVLEQELVRAEAENLVAEAQLSNVTRQKFKEAYEAEFAAVIERAERQIILAKHGRRLLELLDDSPMTPGDAQRVYEHGSEARQILNDAEDDLRQWQLNLDNLPYHGSQEDAVREPTPESSVATGAGHGSQSAQGEQGMSLPEATLRDEGCEPALAGSSSIGAAS